MSTTDLNLSRKNKRTTYMDEFDLMNFFRHFVIGFKKLLIPIIMLMIVAGGSVFAYFKMTYVPEYTSTISFSAVPLSAENSNNGVSIYTYTYKIGLSDQLSVTFPNILESGLLYDLVRNQLGRDVVGTISAESIPGTNVFELSATCGSPDDAYDMITSVMDKYPQISENFLGDIDVNVIIPPKKPTSPSNANNYVTYVLIAIFGGFVAGIAITIIYVLSRKTVCNKNDVKYALNQVHLGEIPLVREKKKKTESKNKIRKLVRNRAFTEANRSIKNRTINILNEKGFKIIGITATTDNEGKRSFATGYAKALSNENDKVLLVTINSEKSGSALEKSRKTSRITTNDLAEISTEKRHPTLAGIKKLFSNVDVMFIDAKEFTSNNEELKKQFEKLKLLYSRIIIDMPACNSHIESVTIANYCDTYIMVVRCDFTSTKKINEALKYLSFSKAESMGVVLNEVSSTYISYGRYNNYGKYGAYSKYSKYGYGYGYGKGYGYGYGYGYGNYGMNTDHTEKDSDSAESK